MSRENKRLYGAIKLYGNIVKVLTSAHLRLFPSVRRNLPVYDAPRRAPRRQKKIPHILWQTNFTGRVALQVYASYKFNRFMAPSFEYRFQDDDACDAFVKENYPGKIWDAYSKLQIGAAKADFWRILALHKYGGLYMDMDAAFSGAPESFIPDDAETMFITTKSGEVTNYFMGCVPGHPLMMEIAERIIDNIHNPEIDSVYDMTGPTVVDAVVKAAGVEHHDYHGICSQGLFTNKRGQYVDKKEGHWIQEQQAKAIVRS